MWKDDKENYNKIWSEYSHFVPYLQNQNKKVKNALENHFNKNSN